MTTEIKSSAPDIIKCAHCSREYDADTYASTRCNGCALVFCDAWGHTCFSDFHKKSDCKGTSMTVLSPNWPVNLRTTIK